MRSDVRHANNLGDRARARRLGLVVNPVAGMGGVVGLKGTDGADTLVRARSLGAQPVAAGRTARALSRLGRGERVRTSLVIVAPPGEAGADLARAAGFAVEEIALPPGLEGGQATEEAARRIVAAGVELLLFAGGDGTARDVTAGAPGASALGVPTGVKMQSGVFAATPEAAGEVALAALSDAGTIWRDGEVMDLDEDALRNGHVAPRLYGVLRVPVERRLMANPKARSFGGDEAALEALADVLVGEMAPGRLYVLGCGTTIARIKRRLGGGTLLGVDVALDGRLIATDANEERLLRLTEGCAASVIVAATGGQGFLFGRGNQQISPQLLRRVGRENVVVVTGAGKLVALDPPLLRVDTGDPELDAALAGYIRVRTAPGQSMMMRVAA